MKHYDFVWLNVKNIDVFLARHIFRSVCCQQCPSSTAAKIEFWSRLEKIRASKGQFQIRKYRRHRRYFANFPPQNWQIGKFVKKFREKARHSAIQSFRLSRPTFYYVIFFGKLRHKKLFCSRQGSKIGILFAKK